MMTHQREMRVWVYLFLLLLVAGALAYVSLAAPNTGDPAAPGRTPFSEAALSFVQNNLRAPSRPPFFAPFALVASVLLGSLHALAPGHNKLLIMAYLVALGGRLRHAVWIGLTTAIAHAISAAVLGLLAESATRQATSVQFLRWVGLPSGLLTIALGFWLLRRPGRPDRVGLGGVILLGLVTGLVPTFDAIAIMVVALSVQQAGLGVGLMVGYSLGIAATVVAVGALSTGGRDWLPANSRVYKVVIRVAAVLVLLLGLQLTGRTLLAIMG
ncbi:MAG: hypothetical protein AB1791_09295 [Chloroflexota bacterium]